jgi:hypothetical protein
MTLAHLGVAIVAAYVGRDWRGRTLEGNICTGLICILSHYVYLTQTFLHYRTVYHGDRLHGHFPLRYFPPVFVHEESQSVRLRTGYSHRPQLIQINNFFIGLITPPMLDIFQWGTYLYLPVTHLHRFFGTFCALSILWVYNSVPETRKVALEDMVPTLSWDSS